jgi:hypothetical protein
MFFFYKIRELEGRTILAQGGRATVGRGDDGESV